MKQHLKPQSVEITSSLLGIFVDNTDVIQTGLTINSTAMETLPLMQVALNLWNNGLSATGGISPQKIILVLD